jgi:tRNA-Thr(GGU) m(6)t(6)A37 methyltransferase TsaA
MMDSIVLKPIGVVRSEHTRMDKTPVLPVFAEGCRGTVEVFPEYAAGLQDIEGFSHIYLLFYMDRAVTGKLLVKPFVGDVERGVFATRSPSRPNPIGLSVVELIRREENILLVDGLDILDGTAVLDIKPFIGKFDNRQTTRDGWLDEFDDSAISGRAQQAYEKPAAGSDQP